LLGGGVARKDLTGMVQDGGECLDVGSGAMSGEMRCADVAGEAGQARGASWPDDSGNAVKRACPLPVRARQPGALELRLDEALVKAGIVRDDDGRL
jgi:hypothetical protein